MAISEEREFRVKKLNELTAKGVNAYPSDTQRTATCEQCVAHFDEWMGDKVIQTIVGRVKSIRLHGGSAFVTVEDGTGEFQLFLRKNIVGDDQYAILKENVDLGDFLESTGTFFVTKTEEKTMEAQSFRVISKALLPLPEKWHGLSDMETRYRQRYLDLIANPEVRAIFVRRSMIVQTMRHFFEDHAFLEVETPILQSIPGGATARPFVTHHNALDVDMYLRIAPELYLKRLVVGGFERVFEFSRCFRNEGIDHSHNPEFTQVEGYMAYADYHGIMDFIEKMFGGVVEALYKKNEIEYEGNTISFKAPFIRLSFRDAILKNSGVDIDTHLDATDLLREARDRGVDIETGASRAKIMDELFKEYVVKKTVNPTYVIDYPIELSPLAKKKADDPRYTERFQLVVAGIELVNGFSELNDPQDQRMRFEEQEKYREGGDEEAHRIDEDFITALEHGMPPTAGFGIGIDRLTALLTNSHNLKEVIFFPTLRPKVE
ncbi:MAG: lysine--tRNA ligase [bacterium]|nr:lysine--tRNA ligase [bacterium]